MAASSGPRLEAVKKPAIGWIGIGKMGAPMSRRVLAAGYPVSVFEPVAQNRATVVAEGASLATSIAQMAGACDIMVSTIPNDHVLRAIVFGEDGLGAHLKPGQIFVEMSTVSPGISTIVAAELQQRGVDYIRAPVSGSTATAQDGKLTVFASGPEHAYASVRELLTSFSVRQYYVGAAEEARYLKLVLNTLVGATSALVAEALSLGASGGLSRETMLEVISESAVASPLIGYKKAMLVSRQFEPAFSVDQMIKDFDLIGEAARERHVPMLAAALVRQQYEIARAMGHGDRDFFVLSDLQEKLAGQGEGEVQGASPLRSVTSKK